MCEEILACKDRRVATYIHTELFGLSSFGLKPNTLTAPSITTPPPAANAFPKQNMGRAPCLSRCSQSRLELAGRSPDYC